MATAEQRAPKRIDTTTTQRPFEILPEHRERSGWAQLWERLFRPLPENDPVEAEVARRDES